jgi:hypothetical protein
MTQPGSRRGFMRHLGIGSAAALGSVALPATVFATAAGAQASTGNSDVDATDPVPPADVDALNLAAGLEAAASQACGQAVARRLLGAIDSENVRIFGDHHLAHANSLVEVAGSGEANIEPNAALLAELTAGIAGADDANALLVLMHELEEQLAATHQVLLGQLESNPAATAVGRVLPIDAQQATVMGQALDLPIADWLPNTQTTVGALDLAAYGA